MNINASDYRRCGKTKKVRRFFAPPRNIISQKMSRVNVFSKSFSEFTERSYLGEIVFKMFIKKSAKGLLFL